MSKIKRSTTKIDEILKIINELDSNCYKAQPSLNYYVIVNSKLFYVKIKTINTTKIFEYIKSHSSFLRL